MALQDILDQYYKKHGGDVNPPNDSYQPDDEYSPLRNIYAKYVNKRMQENQPNAADVEKKITKQLPVGAIDWLPNGEAYYGPGVSGWLKGASARINEPYYRKNAAGEYEASTPNPLQASVRYIKEGVGAALNTMTGLQEGAQAALLSPVQTLEDLADMSNSYLPDLVKGEVMRNWMNYIPGVTAVEAAYNGLRILTGSRQLSGDVVGKTARANAVLYSNLFGTNLLNANTREEFMRRFNAGEKPDYLVAEMANPLAELGADLILDPFNLAGAFMSKAGQVGDIAKVAKNFDVLDDVKDSLKTFHGLVGSADEAGALAELAAKIIPHNIDAAKKLVDIGSVAKPWQMTNTGRMGRAADTVGQFFQVMLKAFEKSPDDFGEALRASALIGSSDEKLVQEGLQIWSRINPELEKLVLSERGMETSRFLNRMLDIGDDKFSGKSFIKLAQEGDLDKLMKAYETKANAVLKEMYPSIHEIGQKQDEIKALVKAGKEVPADLARYSEYKVPDWARRIADVHQKIQVDWKLRGLNGKLSEMYITLNPGAGFRNLFNNVFTAAIDFTPGIAVDTGKSFGARVAGKTDPLLGEINDWLGFVTKATERGTGGAGALETGENLLIKGITRIHDSGEKATSAAITYNVVRREMMKAFKEGVAFAPADGLRAAGFADGEVQRLMGLARKHKGNMDLAMTEFIGEVENGVAQVWRQAETVLSKADYADLNKFSAGLPEDVEKILNNYKDPDQATAMIEELRRKWKNMAKDDVNGFIPSFRSEESADIGQDVLSAVEDGLNEGDANLFNTKLLYQRQATEAIVSSIRAAMRGAIDDVAGDAPRAKAITSLLGEMEDIYPQIVKDGSHDAMRKVIREDIFKKNNTTAVMMNQAENLPEWGKYFKGTLTNKNVKDEIWKYYFARRQDLHQDQLGKLVDSWSGLLDKASVVVGRDLSKADAIVNAQQTVEKALRVMAADVVNETGAWVDPVKLLLNKGKTKDAIMLASTRDFKMGSAVDGRVSANEVLNAINKYLPDNMDTFATLDDVPYEVAQTALKRRAELAADPAAKAAFEATRFDPSKPSAEILNAPTQDMSKVKSNAEVLRQANLDESSALAKNPLSFLNESGGIPKNEFKEILGGSLGKDKANVPPGLFRKTKGDIGEVGLTLHYQGYIPDIHDAEDPNFVREFIRKVIFEGWTNPKYQKVEKTTALTGETLHQMLARKADPADIRAFIDEVFPGELKRLAPEELANVEELTTLSALARETDMVDAKSIQTVTNYAKRAQYMIDNAKTGEALDEYLKGYSEIAKYIPDEEIANAIRQLEQEAIEAAADAGRTAGANVGDIEAGTGAADAVGAGKATDKLTQIPIPVIGDTMPTMGQAARENLPGVNALLDRLDAGIKATWGKGTITGGMDASKAAALQEWIRESTGRISKTRAIVAEVATKERDFALLNYGEKTALDHALAYIMPYQYWYSRTYKNWVTRLSRNPEILSKYANYRQYLEQAHADLPEWWKYNVSRNDLPGMHTENPMYFNLEATLNPLNGITGIDFEDKNKIVGEPGTFENFWTSTLDGIGKYGPSVFTPVTMITALALKVKGEEDAAQRWAGRLIPQTLPIKAVASLAGQNWELDPFVNFFSGNTGVDAYETRRVGRMLGAMIDDGTVTAEQALEAARARSGPAWEEAKLRASKDRAGANLMGFAFGVGFKQRSANDKEIDQFYESYNNLWKTDNLSPQEMKVGMDTLRQKFPFMDTVLLSRQGGVDRDRAYAYSVLGRIAPGDTSKILKSAGLPSTIIDKFYASKGNMANWSEDDKLKFKGAMVSIGTTLAIPKDATQQEWTAARNNYRTMSDMIAADLGADIWDKVDGYYQQVTPEDKEMYLSLFPEVEQAMNLKAQMVMNNPLLSTYYNGLENMEMYYKGEMRREVLNTLGANYFDLLRERKSIFDKAELARWDKTHNIKALGKQYDAIKKKWSGFTQRQLLAYGDALPKGTQSQVIPGLDQNNLSTGQEAIIGGLQETPSIPWEQVAPLLTPAAVEAIQRYITEERDFTASEEYTIKRVADYMGVTLEELIRSAYAANR